MRPRFELIKIRIKLSTTNHPYPVVLTALDSTYEHAFPHSLLQMCLSSLLQFGFGINSGLMFTIIFLRHHGTNELVIFQNNPNNWDIMLYLSHIDESNRVLHALYSAFVGLLYLRREPVASTVQYCTNIHISGGGINCTINIFQGSSRVPTLLISYHRWSKCASWKQYAVQATIPQGERKFLNEGGLDWRGGRHIRDKLATVCSPPMWGHWAGTGFTHGLCFV
jgi:hypothetical protein